MVLRVPNCQRLQILFEYVPLSHLLFVQVEPLLPVVDFRPVLERFQSFGFQIRACDAPAMSVFGPLLHIFKSWIVLERCLEGAEATLLRPGVPSGFYLSLEPRFEYLVVYILLPHIDLCVTRGSVSPVRASCVRVCVHVRVRVSLCA